MKRPDATGGASLATGLSREQWADFLRRHDPVWETLPDSWEHGAFFGDGLLGAMVHLTGEGESRRLIWEIGRTDVYDPRPDPASVSISGGRGITKRLLIGQFQLAVAFHENLLRAVDQNIVDRVILEQGFQRTKARHLEEQILAEGLAFFTAEDDTHFF